MYERLYTSLLKETRDPTSGKMTAAVWPIFLAAILRQSYKALVPLAIMVGIFFLYAWLAEPRANEGTIVLSPGEAQEFRGTVVLEPRSPSFSTLVGGFFLVFVAGAVLGPLLASIGNFHRWVFEDLAYALLPSAHRVTCGEEDDLSAEIYRARPTIANQRSTERVRQILTELIAHRPAKQEGAQVAEQHADQGSDDL